MRAIRNAVDATRRALDDPTGAYRHDEAVVFAANAVEESPGREELLLWEARLIAGDHDPNFNYQAFLFGTH